MIVDDAASPGRMEIECLLNAELVYAPDRVGLSPPRSLYPSDRRTGWPFVSHVETGTFHTYENRSESCC